jgi:heme oxygenase
MPELDPARLQEAPTRAYLRKATRAWHARLEGLLPLASSDLTLGAYVTALQVFLGVYTVLEAQVEPHGSELDVWGLDWPRRRKVPWLRRDADALGRAFLGACPVPAPDAFLLRLSTFPDAMGCLYVTEGATLGGKVIARNVRRVLGLGPDTGASFFDGYGSAVGTQWQSFCAALERSLPDEPSRAQAADAAIATFRLFTDHLSHAAA